MKLRKKSDSFSTIEQFLNENKDVRDQCSFLIQAQMRNYTEEQVARFLIDLLKITSFNSYGEKVEISMSDYNGNHVSEFEEAVTVIIKTVTHLKPDANVDYITRIIRQIAAQVHNYTHQDYHIFTLYD